MSSGVDKELPPVISDPIVISETPNLPYHYMQYYKPETVIAVTDEYFSGKSLFAISKNKDMPSYNTLLRWRKEIPEFRNKLMEARETRAMFFEEMAEEAVHEELSTGMKDRAAAARMKFDLYKWRAEVNDPAIYGKKTQVSGDPTRPIIFNINTGVPKSQYEKEITLDEQGIAKVVESQVMSAASEVTSGCEDIISEEVGFVEADSDG